MKKHIATAFTCLLCACGSDYVAQQGQLVCAPGKTEVCACVGAVEAGAQTCDGDGQGWGVCECPMEAGAAGQSFVSGGSGDNMGGSAGSNAMSGGAGSGGSGAMPAPWTKLPDGKYLPNPGCSLSTETAVPGVQPPNMWVTFKGECGSPCVKVGGENDFWWCPNNFDRG